MSHIDAGGPGSLPCVGEKSTSPSDGYTGTPGKAADTAAASQGLVLLVYSFSSDYSFRLLVPTRFDLNVT